MLERRRFLKGSTASLVVAAVGPTLFFSGRRAGAASPGAPDRAIFDGWLGGDFTLVDQAGPPLSLLAVEDGPDSARVEQFRAIFQAARGTGLSEGSHLLHTPDGTALRVFLKPAGADAYGELYEAAYALVQPIGGPSC